MRQEGRLLEYLFQAADSHPEDAGEDDTIGDLQDLVRAGWEIMNRQQQTTFLKK